METSISRIGSGLVALLGLAMISFCLLFLIPTLRSAVWPSTQGILKSVTQSSADPSKSIQTGIYEYQVGFHNYMAKVPTGETIVPRAVTVHYDPVSPAHFSSSTSASPVTIMTLIFGILILLVGLNGLLFGSKDSGRLQNRFGSEFGIFPDR